MAINIGASFLYKGEYYLDERLNNVTSELDLLNWSILVPEGFEVYLPTTGVWYTYSSLNDSPTTGKFVQRDSSVITKIEGEITKTLTELEENITTNYETYVDNSIEQSKTELQSELDNKVDKEPGAGLYPDADREKLANLSESGSSIEVVVVKGEGDYSTVSLTDDGNKNNAIGDYSHAEGAGVTAVGRAAHAEGYDTTASGDYSHAEGYDTTASGNYSHAEGSISVASGIYSHAEGYSTKATGNDAHAEGNTTTASGESSHAEGFNSSATGSASHAEGQSSTASGSASHAEGASTQATSAYSHSEGYGTIAEGKASHSEGYETQANGQYSHAEGYDTTAGGEASHAQGYDTTASGNYSFAGGNYSRTGDSADCAFSFGNSNFAEHANSVVMGTHCESTGHASVNLGYFNGRDYISEDIEINGDNTQNKVIPAPNYINSVYGSAAFGQKNSSFGTGSFASGYKNLAYTDWSFVHGCGIETTQDLDITGQFIIGEYPEIRNDVVFAIGRGKGSLNTSNWDSANSPERKNIFSIDMEGRASVSNTEAVSDNNLVTKSWVDTQLAEPVANLTYLLDNFSLVQENTNNIAQSNVNTKLFGTRTTINYPSSGILGGYSSWHLLRNSGGSSLIGKTVDELKLIYSWPYHLYYYEDYVDRVLSAVEEVLPIMDSKGNQLDTYIFLNKINVPTKFESYFPSNITSILSNADLTDESDEILISHSGLRSGSEESTGYVEASLTPGGFFYNKSSLISNFDISNSSYFSIQSSTSDTSDLIGDIARNLKVYVSKSSENPTNLVDITEASYIRSVELSSGDPRILREITYVLPKGTKYFKVVNVGDITVSFSKIKFA